MADGEKKSTGATRMKEKGYTLVSLWLDPTELKLIQRARRCDLRPLATWARSVLVEVAIARGESPESP